MEDNTAQKYLSSISYLRIMSIECVNVCILFDNENTKACR